jgi:hypothetical protein
MEGAPVIESQCWETKAGAWAIVVTAETQSSCDGEGACSGPVDVRWDVVHIDRVGDIARLPRQYVWGLFERTEFKKPVLSDLDGDGEEELVLPATRIVYAGANEGRVESDAGHVYHFGPAGLTEYAAATNLSFFDAEDVDGDGRIDLLTHEPFVGVTLEPHMPIEIGVTGPTLVRHARADGAFSMNDDVARSYARRACPAPPAAILAGAEWGNKAEFLRLACARLWGATDAELKARIAEECQAKIVEAGLLDADPSGEPSPFSNDLCPWGKSDIPTTEPSKRWHAVPFTFARSKAKIPPSSEASTDGSRD